MKDQHGFRFLSVEELPEYRAASVHAVHEQSGCELFHLRNEDRENLFAFVFKTPPSDSTGVAHILEHTVLCGSERFPVKDPFVMLMRGSLSTFVNALTYPDKTVYPASSTVPQDLFNIMKVYGDAVFHPLLREEFFMQEGHRLVEDEAGNLGLAGIVYNEMTGNYANHDSIVAEWSVRALMPDTPYGHDSGGDPDEIPRLSYEAFRQFHASYYHPSNCRVFLYGNIPTERYLEFLNTEFLSSFEARPVDISVPRQPRWDEPKHETHSSPADAGGEGTTSVTVSWLLEPVTRPDRVLAFELLSEILLATSAAPLRKRLIDSGLGEDLSAATGLESDLAEMVFSVGLRGIDPSSSSVVEELILDELQRLVDDGIDPDIVEAAMLKVEFRNRELRGGPNGLRLMGRSLRGWLHGENPRATLEFQNPFQELREAARPGSRFFESMIRDSLIANTHRATVTVHPDPEHSGRTRMKQQEQIDRIEAELDDAGRESLREKARRLDEVQETPDSDESIATIPFLRLMDLPGDVEVIPADHSRTEAGVELHTHDLFTNGIVYVDLVFDLDLPGDALHPLLPFFASTLGEVGIPGMRYDQVATEVALKTGGLAGYVDASLDVCDGTKRGRSSAARRRLFVRLKTLESTAPDALDLVGRVLTESDFGENRRLEELWKERRSEISGAVLPAGSGFVSVRAARPFSDASRNEEVWHGVSQLVYLNSSTAALGQALSELQRAVFRRENLVVNVTAQGRALGPVRSAIDRLIDRLPAGGREDAGVRDSPAAGPAGFPEQEALVVPSDVAYVAAAVRGSFFGSQEHAHELILAHMLRTGYLWEVIRMRGGAYGANAAAKGLDGVFAFSSYRDPRIVETIEAFSDGLHHYAKSVPGRDLELAQIGVTGHDIRPLSPGQKGFVSLRRHLMGVTDALRQEKRDAILTTSASSVRRAAERLRATMDRAAIVAMAGSDALDVAAQRYPGLGEYRTDVPL